MTCDRCTDTETCLNCQSAAKSAAFILNRKRNEARHAICEAGYTPCANRIHYVPGNPEGDPIPRVAMLSVVSDFCVTLDVQRFHK